MTYGFSLAIIDQMTERIETPQTHPIQVTEMVIGPEFIDSYGHVNYKAYFALLEPAQDQYIEDRGLNGFDEIERRFGLRSFVKKVELINNSELLEGDKAVVTTSIGHIGNTSFSFIQSIALDGRNVADYTIVIVLTNEQGKAPIPNQLRDDLLRHI